MASDLPGCSATASSGFTRATGGVRSLFGAVVTRGAMSWARAARSSMICWLLMQLARAGFSGTTERLVGL